MADLLMSTQTVINADCLEYMKTLPDKSFDLCLTDPPYGISVQHNHAIGGRNDKALDTSLDWDNSIPTKEFFEEIRRVSKEQIIWGANYFNCFGGENGAIIWDKIQPLPTASQAEIASYSRVKKVYLYRERWTNYVNTKVTSHPTEKSIELMRWCLSIDPSVGTVLDPFMGSGTTLVAAKELGITATGIEISPKYCEIARNRLAQQQLF